MRRKNTLDSNERDIVHSINKVGAVYSFIECLDLFLSDARLRNVREATLNYYERELEIFHRELDIKDINSVGIEVLRNVIHEHKNRGLKTSSINTRLRAVKTFYKYLYERKIIKRNPAESLKLLRDREPIITTYSTKQIKQLLSACDLQTFVGVRDYTVFLLLYDTGIRLSELTGIEVDDVYFVEEVIKIRSTKNNFERFVPLQKTLAAQLRSYLKIRGVCESNALFVTLDGTPISNRQTQNRFTYYGNKVGLNNMRNSPHTMRHTFAKNYIQNGGGSFDLMRIMGHSSLEMTKRYVRLFSSEINEKHRSCSPLENLRKK